MTATSILARNLAAGARLALGMPVRRIAFRIDVAQLLLLLAFSSLVDVAGDWVRYGPDAHFSWFGAGNELFSFGLLVVAAALIAVVRQRAALALALPVIVLAGAPLIQVVDIAMALAYRAIDIPAFAASWLAYVTAFWFCAMIVRAVWVASEDEGRRRLLPVLVAGAVLASPTWLAPSLFPSLPWWHGEDESGVESRSGVSPVSELVQAAQKQMLDDALDALDDERPGVTDLYFVGFAADVREPILRDDVLRAQQVMDERWDTRGRSIVLANHPDTMLEIPFATVTHLRETLREIGSTIDPDSDVVMIYIAGRGSATGVEVVHAPLDLLPVSPSTLYALLDDAGIKWRIVVVSACEAGAFHEALDDDETIVLTAGDGGSDSPGCARDERGTALGGALFARGLAEHDVFADALQAAVSTLSERSGKAVPAPPVLSIGTAMASVLKALDRGNAARRNGRSV